MDKRPHAPDCFCYKCEAEQFSAARAAKDEADERLSSHALFEVGETPTTDKLIQGIVIESDAGDSLPLATALIKHSKRLERTLRFILDECDWEEYRGGPCGGGDERIGDAIRKGLSANAGGMAQELAAQDSDNPNDING